MLRITKGNAKTISVILGFASTFVGTIWSFLVADRLSKEMSDLTDKKASIISDIGKMEAAASQYFVMNQQGDLIFILGHQPNVDTELAVTMYRGNLLDREVPIRNMIATLAIAHEADYRAQSDEYLALEKTTADKLSLTNYEDLKKLEKDIVERGQKLVDQRQKQFFEVSGQINSNEAKQTVAKIVGLVFTIFGAVLLLLANLIADSRTPSHSKA
jgi:hypothetical protein